MWRTPKTPKTPQERLHQSWESFKKAWRSFNRLVRNVWFAINDTLSWIWNIVWWTYQAVDAWDKKIWEKIEKKMQEKWKDTTWKVKKFFRNNMLKVLLWTSIAVWWTYWWHKIAENIKDRNEENTELVIDENEQSNIQSVVTEDLQYIEQWVKLLRDWPLTFYVVKQWECLSVIKEKLQKIPEFSYLSQPEYYIPKSWRNIKWFNTPANSLTPWFFLPIPMKAEDREIQIAEFKKCAQDAITQLKTDSHYGEKISTLLKSKSEKDIINIMTAYARCETSQDWSQFSDPIWSVELHRREPSYRAYSFSYFHILMWQWPWITARKNLGLTEWDCYDATNACKLFLWYCFEKKPNNVAYFFDVNDLESAKTVWKTYNWSRDYGNKLRANITHCKNH